MTKVFSIVGHDPHQKAGIITDPDRQGYVNQHGLSRKHIFDSVKKSLERLQLDYIDVLQCKFNSVVPTRLTCIHIHIGHRFDPNTPIEETVGGYIPSTPHIC